MTLLYGYEVIVPFLSNFIIIKIRGANFAGAFAQAATCFNYFLFPIYNIQVNY